MFQKCLKQALYSQDTSVYINALEWEVFFSSLNYAAKHHSITLSLNKTYHIVKVIFFFLVSPREILMSTFCVQTGDLIKGCWSLRYEIRKPLWWAFNLNGKIQINRLNAIINRNIEWLNWFQHDLYYCKKNYFIWHL